MPEAEKIIDADFESQLRGLFQEAEKEISQRIPAGAPAPAVVKPAPEPVALPEPVEAPRAAPSIPHMLRPVVLGLEAVTRATGDNTVLLNKLDKAALADSEARNDLPKIVSELRTMLEMKSGVNQSMFSALHEELKGYKDGFLLESVHRPIIRDLITLYDDLAEIHRQIAGFIEQSVSEVKGAPAVLLIVERMKTMDINIEHNLDFIVEVLARLDVTQLPVGSGKLDKRTQRAVAVELAEDPDEDTLILRTVKRGFLWKERVVRAEEVVMKKWKEGFLVAFAPPASDTVTIIPENLLP